jgi:hypothetical protein
MSVKAAEIRGKEATMLRDKALDDKINQFLRRKENQYPVLHKMSKYPTDHSGNFRKAVNPQPYIDIIS